MRSTSSLAPIASRGDCRKRRALIRRLLLPQDEANAQRVRAGNVSVACEGRF